IWMERGYTGLHAGFYMSEFPVPTWKHLLWWSNYRFRLPHSLDHWYGGYLGVSLVALAAYGLVKVFRTGRREKYAPGLAAGLCLLVALILVFGYRWPVLRSLGVVQALSAGRYLLFVVFFLSVMVGLGAAFLVEAQRGVRTPERVFVLALLVVLVDLGPTTFQQPYRMSNINRRMDRSRFERLLEDPNVWALARPLPLQYLPVFERFQEERNNRPPGELSPERLFHTTNGTYYHFIIPWLGVNTGVPTVLDTYTQYPLSVPAFVRRFQDLFHTSLHRLEDGADLEKMEYFDLIQTGLFLLNTRHVFYSYSEEEYLQYREFPQVAPLVVAPRTARWTYPVKELDRSRARSLEADEVRAKQDRDRAMKDFSGLLRTMEVDLSRGTCKQILLSEDEPEEDLGTSPQVEILSHQVWNQRVELRVRTSDACFARLAYTYYPYQRLTVDGQVAERLKTAGHFVALRLAPGEHTIVLEPELSVLRTCLLFLSAGLLAAAGVVLVRFRRKEQRDFKR
ncbi:MAG: hypothetical protein O2954_20805, partial [bacterium]|nr:hypothetical protein [bacterium]